LPSHSASAPGLELDDFVREYEAAWARGERVELTAYLPEPGHPLHRSVLRELICIDLEYHWARGEPRHVDDYRHSFPDLFRDQDSLDAIAFEEYRQRRQAGEDATPQEYARRFGVDVTDWPSRDAPERERHHWGAPIFSKDRDLELTSMPRVGGRFHGFHLLDELGRGSFGRVYLCRQDELADRLIVLKIVAHQFGETRMLAQLQHSHIVPIYSVHQADAYHAICMPFLGTTTLADIVKDLQARPALPVSGKYLLDRVQAGVHVRADSSVASHGDPGSSGRADCRAPLEKLTYVDAILWLAARLANGLAHAHDRGIVHRDLKPANILLTDLAQPMLLDFNLSEDTKPDRRGGTAKGGTLPYMAPEQLAAIKQASNALDQRSDLYSFGIVLYELLTGRHPFARLDGPRAEALRGLLADRRGLPEVRRFNLAVSLGAESIVRHCLEPEPARRYQSARELQEDLERQLADRPLVHAREPSLRERARKWTRRHPRLSSSTSVGLIAAVLILALAGAFTLRVRHLARLSAEHQDQRNRLIAAGAVRGLHDDLKTIEALLGTDVPDGVADQREEGIALARKVVDRFQVLESPGWQESKPLGSLAAEQRRQLGEDMGEILLLLAGAVARRADNDLALRLNARAVDCFPAGTVPRALWRQRAELTRSAGHAEQARELEKRVLEAPEAGPRDRFLFLLAEYRHQGRLPEALPLLQETSRRLNDHFPVWMILGSCYAEIGKHAEAANCYELAGTLWPEAVWPHFCQGLACLDQKDYRRARTAFDEVIRLRPTMQQAFHNRALAMYYLGDLPGAEADLTQVLSDSKPPLRAYLLRARVRAKKGDREGARRDQEEGFRGEPRDERDLTARGLARQSRDPQAALADYEAALKLNPRYRSALQNKANVLAENLGRTAEAIGVLDQAIALYPNYVPARAGRGVLHARLAHREAAHADARETLQRDSEPFTFYQVAGIYALTSRQEPADRREAFRLLGTALSQGAGLDLIENDRDLDAIRDRPEFRELVEAARLRRARENLPPGKPQAGARQRPTGGNRGDAIAGDFFGGSGAENRLLFVEDGLWRLSRAPIDVSGRHAVLDQFARANEFVRPARI
jgi:eukaryotic-like serine/threonine-protein kinase